MKTKTKKWHKTCLVDNCEVVGFNRLHELIPDQYGKKNYCLSVLINRSLAQNILAEIHAEERTAQKEFGCELRSFKRITNDVDGRLCPPDKMVLNLSTDSKNGTYQIGIFDEDNKPFTEPFKTIQEGSHIGVQFDLAMYKTNSVGVSLRLKNIKLSKADLGLTNKVDTKSPFPDADVRKDNFINQNEYETFIEEF